MAPVDATTPPAKLGLWAAVMALIASVVGAGIFSLPRILGPLGPVALIGLALAAAGAGAVAMTFGTLARREPDADGPVSYAVKGFGDGAGFATAWYFWLSAWAGNSAITAAWTGYVVTLFGWDLYDIKAFMIGPPAILAPLIVNLFGSKFASRVQIVATSLTLVVLLVLVVGGIFFVNTEDLGPFNASDAGLSAAVLHATVLSVFSFVGIESVAVLSARIKNPQRNVLRASIIGVTICAILYLLAIYVVMGTVNGEDVHDGLASFALSFDAMFHHPVFGNIVTLAAIASGFAATITWTMLAAEMPRSAAEQGLFPKAFGELNSKGVPVKGLVISTVLAGGLLGVIKLIHPENGIFPIISVLVGVASSVTFLVCSAAMLRMALGDRSTGGKWKFDAITAAAALAFAVVIIVGCLFSGFGSLAVGIVWGAIGYFVYRAVTTETR